MLDPQSGGIQMNVTFHYDGMVSVAKTYFTHFGSVYLFFLKKCFESRNKNHTLLYDTITFVSVFYPIFVTVNKK